MTTEALKTDRMQTKLETESNVVLGSQYQKYDNVSGHYDDTRQPIGLDIVKAFLSSGTIPLSQQSILDAGCGTGSFLHALGRYFKNAFGLEYSEGMLQEANDKCCKEGSSAVALIRGSLMDEPLADQSIHAIITNQVLHHLNGGKDQSLDERNMSHVFTEFFRILKPGGRIIINTSSPNQVRDGFWWAALIPDAVSNVVQRFPTIECLKGHLCRSGFVISEHSQIVAEPLQGKAYLTPDGPLHADYRAGDSTWSLVSDKELKSAMDKIKVMAKDNALNAYVKERDLLRHKFGQTTFLCASKPK